MRFLNFGRSGSDALAGGRDLAAAIWYDEGRTKGRASALCFNVPIAQCLSYERSRLISERQSARIKNAYYPSKPSGSS